MTEKEQSGIEVIYRIPQIIGESGKREMTEKEQSGIQVNLKEGRT